MKRKHLCLAGYALASLAAIGCARNQSVGLTATSPVQSSPAVQQMAADAHQAEVAGDNAQALSLYRQVLAKDPNNAWAKHRVERLSGSVDASAIAQRRLERNVERPNDQPTTSPAVAARQPVQTVAAEQSQTPTERAIARREAAINGTTPTATASAANAKENPFEDWFNEAEQASLEKAAKQKEEAQRKAAQLASSKVPEWATGPAAKPEATASVQPEAKPTEQAASPWDSFAWAKTAAPAKADQPIKQAANPFAEAIAEAKEAPAAQAPAEAKQSVAAVDDEAVFDSLDRREDPFADAGQSATWQSTVAASSGSEDSSVWAQVDAKQQSEVVQATSESSATASIKPVGFAQTEPTPGDGTPLAELCRDANIQVLGLVQKLESPMATVRREGLNELGLLGKKARTARLPVRILCEDPVAIVAAEAAWTLWQIDGDNYQSVRYLTTLIDSDDSDAANMAIQSLGLIGPDAVSAAPILRSRLTSANGVRRVRISEALVRIEPQDTGALQALVEGTRYGRPPERVEATYALAHTPAEHLNAIAPVLVNALHDEDESVRTAAALTLGSFGPAAEQARLALEAASRFDTRPVRDAARATLACLPRE